MEYTLYDGSGLAVFNGTMAKQHLDNDTYRYTDFWYDYLDTTDFADGFYRLNVSVWDVGGNRADDVQYVVVYNGRPWVEFLNLQENDSLGARAQVLVRTCDVFDVVNATLNVTHVGSGNVSVYGMVEGYFQKQNLWMSTVYFNASGNYVLSVGCTNYYGVGSDTVSLNVSVDVTRPSVTINSPRPGEWIGGNYTLNVTAEDDNGIGSVQWRVYVIENETTGEYRIPYNYSDVWNGTTPRGNNIYTYDWDTTSLNPDEWLTHGYIIVFKVTDNNYQPNTVYQSVGVWVDNDYPHIISGPLVRSENNVEEREGSRSVIYTRESVGSLSFALYDKRLAMYYDIDENQSWANLEAYLNCLNISILDEYENGSQVFNSCEIVNGSGGLFLEVRNYPLYTGRHNLTLTVTDLAGNTNQSVHTVDIVVDQVPPIVIPVLPRTGMWLKRVINANPFAEAFDWFAYSFLSTMGWILDLLKLNYEQTWNMIGDDWMEGVLFGAYVDDFDSPVLNETIYVQLNYRPGLLYRMTSDYMIYLDSMDEHPCDRLLAQGEQFRSALGGELYSRILSCSGYQDLGLTIFEEWYGDNVFWTAVELSPWDFPLNIWSQSWLNPNTFTCKFSAWDKAGNLGTAYSTFGVIPYASALTLQFDMTSASWFLTGLFGCQAYIDAIQSEITLVTSGRKGGENQGGACMSHGVSSSEPNTDANLLYSASYTTPAENGGVCMGDGEGENETGCDPLDSLITVESTLNYEFYEETSFLPWMKFSFRVFGAPRDISLNVKFGQAPFIRLFFDPLSFQKYGRGEDSVLLRAAPNTWNTFTLPLYRMAEGLGLFEGLNAPTNISAVSVTAYGERNVWERRAVFNGFWIATPVPLVEEYAEKAALSRDNYYRILNVTRESNLNQLKEDIFEIFAASYLEDFPHLAQCLEDFTRHLFPAGEMQEFTGASARVVYYNTSSGSVPLYVVYSFPEGLENVSLLAAYNYTNIPDVDLSREAVLNASLTNLCRQLAQGGDAITPYGLTGEDLAYLPYGAASFVIVNDTVCFDRLSARPCTIQSVLATVASIAERAWSQKCIAELVEREVEYREVEALQAFINESVYRVETLKKLMAALQWVNYMHPMNWDWKSFDALVDTYWLSFEYAGWANSTGYQLLAECLVNITRMLDFGDYFGAPPVFITSGEYNRTSGGEGEDCVLIFKAVERERSLDYLLGARQGEVLFAVFNDSSVLNVVRKYGRCVNASLADVYLYFAEMAFMYTVPYDAEDLLNDGVFNAVSELCSSLFAGPLAMLEQIVGNVKDVVECFLNLPFINLVSTLNAFFMQKFTKKLAMLGVSNYVGWLLEEEAANYEADYYSDMDDGGVAQPGQTFNGGGVASQSGGGWGFESLPFLDFTCGVVNSIESGEIQNGDHVSEPLISEADVYGWDGGAGPQPLGGYGMLGGSASGGQQSDSTPQGTGRQVIRGDPYSSAQPIREDVYKYYMKLFVDGPLVEWSTTRVAYETMYPVAGSIFRKMLNYFEGVTKSGGNVAYFRRILGEWRRFLCELQKSFDLQVDGALRVYVADADSLVVNPDRLTIGFADDYESPLGPNYLGVDRKHKFLIYEDRLGAMYSQTVHIKNDPGSCARRLALLKQLDANKGELYTLEHLHRMGLAYRDSGGQLVSCIDRETGEIVAWVCWEKGFKPNGEPLEVITMPQCEEKIERQWFKNAQGQVTGEGLHYKFRLKDGWVIETLHRDINSMIPEVEGQENMLPLWGNPKQPFTRIIYGLMDLLGLPEGWRNLIQAMLDNAVTGKDSQGRKSYDVRVCRKIISMLLSGSGLTLWPGESFDFDMVAMMYEQSFLETLMRTFATASKTDAATYRMPWLLQLGSALANVDFDGGNKRDKTIALQVEINPALLSSIMHVLDGVARGNTPIYRLSADQLKQMLGEGEMRRLEAQEGVKFSGTKGSLILYDYAESIVDPRGRAIFAIPLLKADQNEVEQDDSPSKFIWHEPDPAGQVPLKIGTEKLYRNVKYYALYSWEFENGKPVLKEYRPEGEKTNIVSAEKYIPASLNELGHLLGIFGRLFKLTTDMKSTKSDNFISLGSVMEQLEGLLYTDPYYAIVLLKELGFYEALVQISKVYPIHEATNADNLGFTINSQNEIRLKSSYWKKYPDAQAFYNLYKGNHVPADVNLYILLLSITGAQRDLYDVKKNKENKKIKNIPMARAWLPLTLAEDGRSYICGSGEVDPVTKRPKSVAFALNAIIDNPEYDEGQPESQENLRQIHPLQYLGKPVYLVHRVVEYKDEDTGRIIREDVYEPEFFLDGNMAKDFNQLSPEELMRVRGVQLRYDLKPSHILKIFSNYEKRPENPEKLLYPEEWRIPFLKPFDPEKTEKEQTQLFEKVTKMPEVVHKYLCQQPDGKTEKGQTIRGYYKVHDTILELLLEDTNFDKKPYWTYDGFKARKIQSRLKDAAERFAKSVLQVYLEGREVLATKHFKPFPDIFAVYFLALAKLYDTEPHCIRKLEKLYNPDAEWVKEIVDGVSRGDIASMQELINAICHRLIADVLGFSDSSTLQKVAKTFGQLLEWGRRHFNIISLRPEHLFGAGKLQKSVEIIQNSLARLEEIQSLVAYDTAMSLATSPFDMPWDYRTVYDREETVRYVLRQAQSGLSAKEIADKLGCETSHVKNILNVFRIGDDGQIEERSWTARLIGRLRENYENKLAALMAAPISVQALVGAAKAGIFFKGTQLALGTAMGTHQVAFFMTVLAPILQTVGFTATVALESLTEKAVPTDDGAFYLGGQLSQWAMSPDANIWASLLAAFAVYFTDYVELGCGAFSGVPSFIDMDYVNIVLAGVQAAMMNLGFCYVSEDTIADILKPFLGLFGLKLSPYAAIGLEVAGLASMLPQADQFYKEHIWPIAKLAIGASLMGGVTPVISSALMNTAAISGINMAEQAFINRVWGDPTFEGVSVDFAPLLEYLPLFGGQYDYLGNYITHYVYGMW